jgi:3-hydroxyisobutyrate dehydrogenase-like beta-hydroxyacid dehydrogenase
MGDSARATGQEESDMNEKPKIGWIGCGKMGVPMSAALIQAGYPVVAWDLFPAHVQQCVASGAVAASTRK